MVDRKRVVFWAIASIGLMTAIQLLLLTVRSDWDLCGDEAEYWAWSRRLDWCYFSKGPLIALVIRLGTEIAGGASLWLTGTLAAAVRLPAVVLGAVTAWGVFRLGEEAGGESRVGLLAVLLLPAVPLFRLGGFLITVDTPLVCCWTWAAVWAHRGIVKNAVSAWLMAGLLCALGVLAKLTMLAFPASVGFFLLLSQQHRRELMRPGFWSMCIFCALGLVPMTVWNAQHQWVLAGHLVDRIGLETPWNWGGPRSLLSFFGGEAIVWGFWWPAAAAAVFWTAKEVLCALPGIIKNANTARDDQWSAQSQAGLLYLLCLWGVIWSACLGAAILGEREANWAAPAYVAVLALAGRWLAHLARTRPRPVAMRILVAGWSLTVFGLTVLHHTEWFYPAVSRWLPRPSASNPAPLRRFDPTCRMRGYRELGDAVESELEALRSAGEAPFVLAPAGQIASALSFYLPGQPDVYSLGWSAGMAARAVDQHDFWHPNPRHDADVFHGRPAVIVERAGGQGSYAGGLVKRGIFRASETTRRIEVRRGEALVSVWHVTVCRGYQGLTGVEEIRKNFSTYLSQRYYTANGGTPSGFVRGLYRDILGCVSTPAGESFWVRVLATQPRDLVVASFLSARKTSPEARSGTAQIAGSRSGKVLK